MCLQCCRWAVRRLHLQWLQYHSRGPFRRHLPLAMFTQGCSRLSNNLCIVHEVFNIIFSNFAIYSKLTGFVAKISRCQMWWEHPDLSGCIELSYIGNKDFLGYFELRTFWPSERDFFWKKGKELFYGEICLKLTWWTSLKWRHLDWLPLHH